jgi:hypothetical protein
VNPDFRGAVFRQGREVACPASSDESVVASTARPIQAECAVGMCGRPAKRLTRHED